MARKSRKLEEPSSSQIIPQNEADAQRAAMQDDDEKLAELDRQQEEGDSDYEVSSHEPSSSQTAEGHTTPQKPMARHPPLDDDFDFDDETTEHAHSPGGQSEDDSDDVDEDGMDESSDTEAAPAVAVPEGLTAHLLENWWYIIHNSGSVREDAKQAYIYGVRVAFQRIYGLSSQQARIICRTLYEERKNGTSRNTSGDELYDIVQDRWNDISEVEP